MTDFFIMEATDYLERLDALVSPSHPPDAADFLRLSRALRGSAVMANQPQIGKIAGGLEGMSRGLVEHRITWDEGTRQLAIRAVDDLKVLVRAIRTWSEAEDARAQQILVELDRYVSRPSADRKIGSSGLDSGTRAFIAREGAAVASALDQAARSVASGTNIAAGFEAVARAMQPLRGIASLSELPPFPDLLEGVDRAMGEFQRRPDDTHSADIFDAAAKAVSDVAQQISTGARDLESTETDRFASLLGDLMDLETDVVPIQSLFFADAGPHIVEEGSGPAREQLGRVELVSHLEYLVQATHELERAGTSAQRSLRVHGIVPTLRALSIASGGPVVSAAASFASAAKRAIQSGHAIIADGSFATALRNGSLLLNKATQSPEPPPADRLNALAHSFDDSSPSTIAEPETAPIPTAAPVEMIETPIEAPAADPPDYGSETDLAAAYLVCGDLFERFGHGNGTLEQMVAGPPPTGARRVSVPEPTAPPTAAVESADDVVMITDLQYDASAAMARATDLRVQVRLAVADGDAAGADALLDEIFDLVKIGQDAG